MNSASDPRPTPADVVDQLADRLYVPQGVVGEALTPPPVAFPRCGWVGVPPSYVCSKAPGHPLPHTLIHVDVAGDADAAPPPMTPPSAPICGDVMQGMTCQLAPGHGGWHHDPRAPIAPRTGHLGPVWEQERATPTGER